MNTRKTRDDTAPPGVAATLTGRRTVAKGIAWTVPVVAVAHSVPAFATSCQTFTFGAASCKCSGNSDDDVKGYNLSICFTCPPGQSPPPGVSPQRLTIVSVSKNSGPMYVTPRAGACDNRLPQTVEVGQCTTLIHFNSTDSATPLFVDYYFTDDPSKTIYSVRTDAPPDCVDCSLPVYCCTDNSKPFPQKHVCP